MRFYYSKYGRVNSNIGCGTILKEDDLGDLINGEFLCLGMNSLLSFTINIKNVYSLRAAFQSCNYLTDFGEIGGEPDGKTFNNCYNLRWAFAGLGNKADTSVKFEFIFPVATRFDYCFLNSYNGIKSVSPNSFPKVIYGRSAFENAYFVNFGTRDNPIKFPELRSGQSMFYNSGLENAYIKLPKLLGGHSMFSNCKLNYSSLQYLLDEIRDLKKNPPEKTGANAEINTSGHISMKIHGHLKDFLNENNPEDIETKYPNYFTTVTDKYYGVITIGYNGSDSKNSTSEIEDMKAKFAEKGWTATFIKN